MSKLVALLTRVFAMLTKFEAAGPLLLRFVVGFIFMKTGWGKLHNLEGVTEYFESLGIPAAAIQAPFIATLEFVGGLAVMFGLGTRFFAPLLSGTMVVAIATAKWADVETLMDFLKLEETFYLVVFIALTLAGAGKLSVDALIARRFAPAPAPSTSP